MPVVRVHWYEGSDDFGRRALKIAEDGIEKSATLLGVTEEEPVDFFIYADETAFREALGPSTRENVGGQADSEIRTLFALIPPSQIDDAWVETVIPHELTHLVFDTAVRNPYHYPPRWLNEGLAVYESEGYPPDYRSAVGSAAGDGTLIPLSGIAGQFPTSEDRFRLAYGESVSAVDFFIRTYGQDALVKLISLLRGRPDRRRGLLGGDRRRRRRLRGRLARRPEGRDPGPPGTATGPGRAVARRMGARPDARPEREPVPGRQPCTDQSGHGVVRTTRPPSSCWP